MEKSISDRLWASPPIRRHLSSYPLPQRPRLDCTTTMNMFTLKIATIHMNRLITSYVGYPACKSVVRFSVLHGSQPWMSGSVRSFGRTPYLEVRTPRIYRCSDVRACSLRIQESSMFCRVYAICMRSQKWKDKISWVFQRRGSWCSLEKDSVVQYGKVCTIY